MDGDPAAERDPQVQHRAPLPVGRRPIRGPHPVRSDGGEDDQRDEEDAQAATGFRVQHWPQVGEGHHPHQQDDVGRDRHQQLQPLAPRVAGRAIAEPSVHDAEGQRDPQPGVEVPGRHAEPAFIWTDAPPGPQPHADGDGIEGQIEADGQDGVHEGGVSAAHAERVGDAHRPGDDQCPGQADDDRRAVDGEQEMRRVVIGLEDELVAFLEEDAEGGGGDQLEEGKPSPSQCSDRGPREEARRAELEDEIQGVERHRCG